MSATVGTIYNQFTGEVRTIPMVQAEHMVRNSRGEWSFKEPLPAGWDREIPRYKVTRAVKPAERARYRFEKPFSSIGDNDVWQYAERQRAAGETIETTAWPHASFVGLNETARRTLEFFNSHQKSRLPLSPWRDGRLYLSDGLSGASPALNVLRPPPAPTSPKPARVA